MGILYNRFTAPPANYSLLPYSNQSKVITYATDDNFDENNPDSWGSGVAPIVGSWFRDTDYISSNIIDNRITNTTAIGNAFTIYEVLHQGSTSPEASTPSYNPNIYVLRQGADSNNAIFFPMVSSAKFNYGFAEISMLNCGMRTNATPLHVTAYAYEYSPNSREASQYARCNGVSVSNTRTYSSDVTIQAVRFTGRTSNNDRFRRFYKFIAVVAEKESASVIANNMAHLKDYYSAEY